MSRTFKHMKMRCAGCEQTTVEMTKEHVFPKWLILRTRTNKTGIRWGNKIIPALNATVPLCKACNQAFGNYLEAPVKKVFDDLESQKGISDIEADLLVRWLWKLEGLFWIFLNPGGDYSSVYTLRQKVLLPIDAIRPHLALAISLLESIDTWHGDMPMGLDSPITNNGIFVSGVFSKTAIMVIHKKFIDFVPDNFSVYEFADISNITDGKFFYPKVGFKDDNYAVTITMLSSKKLAALHEKFLTS